MKQSIKLIGQIVTVKTVINWNNSFIELYIKNTNITINTSNNNKNKMKKKFW